jgi:ribonuclease III
VEELLELLSPRERTRALTHPAWVDDPRESFERLEFLGDAVLGTIVSAELYRRFPDAAEGDLSKIRAATVSREACAEVARATDLGRVFIAAAPGSADRALVQDLAGHSRVLAGLVESVIGAAFLECGYDVVASIVLAIFADRIGHAVDNRTDAKSELQELAQSRGEAVEYRVVSVSGPDHDRRFTMAVRLERCGLEATGEGRSKKQAAQSAAARLLESVAASGTAPVAERETQG